MLPLLWLLVARRKNPLLHQLPHPLLRLRPLLLRKHLQQPLPLQRLLMRPPHLLQPLPLRLQLMRPLHLQPHPLQPLPLTQPRSNSASLLTKKPPSGGFFVSAQTPGQAWALVIAGLRQAP